MTAVLAIKLTTATMHSAAVQQAARNRITQLKGLDRKRGIFVSFCFPLGNIDFFH